MGVRLIPKTSETQRALEKAISGFLLKNVGVGAKRFPGELTADIPELFSRAYDEFADGRFAGDISAATRDLIRGEPAYTFEPGSATKRWQETYATPVMRTWTDTALPAILEGMNLPGNLTGFSAAPARAAVKAGGEFFGQQVAPKLFDWVSNWLTTGEKLEAYSKEQAAARRLSATALPYQQFLQSAGTARTYQELLQEKLTADKAEFIRTQAEPGWASLAGAQYMTQPTLDALYKGKSSKTSQIGTIATAVLMALKASDVRLKDNIKPIDSPLDKLSKLNGYTFNFVGDDSGHAGIIAQELEAVLPAGVKEIDGIKFVKLDSVIGLLVSAVNELRKEIQ